MDKAEDLEERLLGTLHAKMTTIQKSLEKQISTSAGGGWRGLVMLLMLLLVVAAAGLYTFYQRLKKMHVL